MIQSVSRKCLDVQKYNDCIEKSVQSRVYAFSWYLDIVADNWDVLVLNDYEAVMPITWRKKYGLKYVYPPFWTLELGVFSVDENQDCKLFLAYLFTKFKWVELRLNTQNSCKKNKHFLIDKQMQILSLKKEYSQIFDTYRKDRKKELTKATKADLTEKWNDDVAVLIHLFQENVGKRIANIKQKDYQNLEHLMQICIDQKVGEVLSVYDSKQQLVASGFFLKHHKKVSILVSSTDFNNRKNGANTFLIDCAIKKYKQQYETFHFGGSSMPSIANYFLSFGSESISYQQIQFHNLPFLFRFFK